MGVAHTGPAQPLSGRRGRVLRAGKAAEGDPSPASRPIVLILVSHRGNGHKENGLNPQPAKKGAREQQVAL